MEKTNKFHVGLVEDTVVIPGLTPQRLSKDDALNLAAHLIALADDPIAFDHVLLSNVEDEKHIVLSWEFVELLGKVQS
jgi:hypothetical protein